MRLYRCVAEDRQVPLMYIVVKRSAESDYAKVSCEYLLNSYLFFFFFNQTINITFNVETEKRKQVHVRGEICESGDQNKYRKKKQLATSQVLYISDL